MQRRRATTERRPAPHLRPRGKSNGAFRPALWGVVAAILLPAGAAASSADELVLQAKAHEAAREDDVAVRRYTEALTLDATNAPAWLGLGDLRMRLGEPAEAERVYAAALARVPSLSPALTGRAKARWALGRHAEAEADLYAHADAAQDIDGFRTLAGWFAQDGRQAAQLAVWRRLQAMTTGDPARAAEARRMVRALSVLVDAADPATQPFDADATRRALAQIARRAP